MAGPKVVCAIIDLPGAEVCPPTDTLQPPQSGVGTIDAFEVEGRDFIFRFPPLGSSYYVIRCDHNFPGPFQNDPLDASRATKHFNKKTPKCHAAGKEYRTNEEVIRDFGYRGEPALSTRIKLPKHHWLKLIGLN
jgi:hypothetical protein